MQGFFFGASVFGAKPLFLFVMRVCIATPEVVRLAVTLNPR